MIVREGREQELVRAFFKGARSGFFVEVGANRPRQESQTWHLERLGWTGVLVEPQPDLAEELRRDRSANVIAVACSSPGNAGRLMRLHVAGALSSLDRDRMAPGADPERIIEVPIRTLDDILIEAGRQRGSIFCRSTSKVTSSKCSAGSMSFAGVRGSFCSKITSAALIGTDS